MFSGWEAGIRTPITWSRERCTDSVPLRSVLFSSGFHLACFRRLRSVSMRSRAKCLFVSQPSGPRYVWRWQPLHLHARTSTRRPTRILFEIAKRRQTYRRPVPDVSRTSKHVVCTRKEDSSGVSGRTRRWKELSSASRRRRVTFARLHRHTRALADAYQSLAAYGYFHALQRYRRRPRPQSAPSPGRFSRGRAHVV